MLRVTVLQLLFVVHILARTETPIIGVLTQESFSVNQFFPNETYKSYIAASYVKYLESAGARVVPIWIGRDEAYYRDIVNKTNGVFWPGGAAFFNESGMYVDAGRTLYKIILETNENGTYFPLWTTCLGMELLAAIAMEKVEARINCTVKDVALPLEFRTEYSTSKLFGKAHNEIIDILSNQNITYNFHKYCITEEMFIENDLLDDWEILSTNKDLDDLEFVSSFESKHYPFYGIQFHPEKNQFEFRPTRNIPHSNDAVKVAQYLANFFVEECRNNSNHFPDWSSEQKALIYNYKPHNIVIQNSNEQVLLYMFDEGDNLS